MANIGDLVSKAGIYTAPGVVVEKKPDGNVLIDTEPMSVNKYHRYANTTGLSEDEKNEFNRILDEIYAKEDQSQRINDIQREIDRLKPDPKTRNVVQYLRNQQTFLVRETKQLPQQYEWDESRIKR